MTFRNQLQRFRSSPYSFGSEHRFITNLMDMAGYPEGQEEDAKAFWNALSDAVSVYEKKHQDNVPSGFVHEFAQRFVWP
jgi:hypothetical protein